MLRSSWKDRRMNRGLIRIDTAAKREHAGAYILTFLIAFSVTVIVTRVFLQLTGFPQIGNSVLHIAHALWGGVFLVVAVLLPLIYLNPWALHWSALMGGLGVGLFIDEVGKFITQANDYFFPPALPLVYGFFLLCVLVYIVIARAPSMGSRSAMYQALDGLMGIVEGDLDEAEVMQIRNQLAIARQSDQTEIAALANVLNTYLVEDQDPLNTSGSDFWTRIRASIDSWAKRIGRRAHRSIILGLIILWVLLIIGFLGIISQGGATIDSQVLRWRSPIMGIQIVVGTILLVALLFWAVKNERVALNLALGGFLVSLVALQTVYFYISQFSAITATLLQFIFLQVLLVYRRVYYPALDSNDRPIRQATSQNGQAPENPEGDWR